MNKEQMKTVLDAMQCGYSSQHYENYNKAISILQTAIDAPEAEPVGYFMVTHISVDGEELWERVDAAYRNDSDVFPLYLHPPHDDTALLRQCLEAFEGLCPCCSTEGRMNHDDAITALRARL